MYEAWKEEVASRGNVTFKLGHEVVEVISRHAKGNSSSGPVQIKYKVSKDGQESLEEFFDELILAVDADSCLKLLGKQSTWMERKILGNVKYLYDVTITHNDLEYMRKVRVSRDIMMPTLKHGRSCTRRSTTLLTTRPWRLVPPHKNARKRKNRLSSRKTTSVPSTTPCSTLKTSRRSR